MTPREIAANYWRIECTRDVDAILQCYEPDGEMLVPGLGRLRGHDAIRRFYQGSVDRFPKLAVEIVGGFETGDRGAFEWSAVFHDHDGREFHSTGVNIIQVRGDRFVEVHAYFDPNPLDHPVAGSKA